MTIWIVMECADMIEGEPNVTLLRACRTADKAKAYITTLPDKHGVWYDWESVELDDDDQ